MDRSPKSKTASKTKAEAMPEAKPGNAGELHQRIADGDALTTNFGVPVSDNQNSLRSAERGPSLLEDFILREKIHHFDHERIPERIVHARGSAAHGVFELHKSLKQYTRAKVLTEVGEQTEVFVRFSTVAGGAGSVDTPRDVRGFAVKMYTKEGNWDLVGNNIPVFFIQDAIKFPDLVHAVKMEADRGYPQAASAHDTFWDFISQTPESSHMVMWQMSDRTIPRAYRFMEGFGVHTFRLINDKGAATLVKFHWRPKLGLQSTLWDETLKLQAADNDYHRRDLYESIDQGDFPQWELGVQLLSQEDADKLPFDVLDATKIIPEEMVPIVDVGTLTLNRNPDNFFAETEQVAFLPTNIPPGIDFSEDPLLQGRLFSYLDTQLSRLGTPNWHQLPVNQAKGCPVHNFQRDGQMQHAIPKGRANYEPNTLAEAGEPSGPRETARGFETFPQPVSGVKQRIRAETFADHYSQARLFFRSQSPVEKNHLIGALVFELSKVTLPHVRLNVLANLHNIDNELASRVANGLGMDLPPASRAAVKPSDMDLSPALRLIDKYPPTLKGRCVGIFVSDGVDAKYVTKLMKAVEDEGAACKIIGEKPCPVELKGGKTLMPDARLETAPSVLFDAVALVATAEAVERLQDHPAMMDWVSNAFHHLKAIGYASDCQPLLDKAHVKPDERILDLEDGPEAFVEAAKGRQWEREKPMA